MQSEITEALNHVPADVDRDTWVKVGMAIKSMLGDAGFETFDQWSRTANNYVEQDAKDTYKSVRADGGITIKTLFAMAREYGYQPSRDDHQKPRSLTLAWNSATENRADDHPYLKIKNIKAHGTRISGKTLLIPVSDLDGKVQSAQLVFLNGGKWDKKFQTGTKLKDDSCHVIGSLDSSTIVLAEGLGAAASIHEATGYTAVICFGCKRLAKVGRSIKARYPGANILIAGDDDTQHKTKNPGRDDAIKAGKEIGAKVVFPSFSSGSGTDFNDLHLREGIEAVRQQIDAGLAQDDTSGDPTQPEPLRAPMPPADPYPVEMLGDVLGAAAQALHEVIKAPLALCCQSVLGAGSLAAQSHFDVKLPWETTAPLSLFLLTVGESGERKSAVDDIVLGAAKEQQKAEMLEYNELLKDHEAASAAWNQAIESAKKSVAGGKAKASTDEIRKAMDGCGEKPTPPISPMRFVTDPTVEGLFKLLAIGQPSVALFSDEGGLLIGGHALNSDNALKTMARWCKLWDGSEFDRVRSGDGSGILYGRRMALHQLSQPDVMVKLLSDPTANGQVFLARCLTAWPSSTIGTRHTVAYSWAGSRNELKRLFGKLKGLMEAKPRTSDRDPQELAPVALPLTLEAQSLAVEAGNIFESLMAPGNDLAELRDRGSKALENACRIAGVLAVVEGGMATREISRSHLERGVNLIQWYLNEALRIRSAAVVPQSVIDAESMLAWLKDRDCKVFRTATLLTHGPSQLRNKKRLDDAIDEAVKCGYLTEQDPGAVVDGVRAKRSWRVLHYVV